VRGNGRLRNISVACTIGSSVNEEFGNGAQL
jgi:hypothetical protein